MTIDDHCRDLNIVLSRLHRANVTLDISKCTFGANRLEYLGSELGSGVLKASPNKFKDLDRLKSPKLTKPPQVV